MQEFKNILFLAESGADNAAALTRALTLAEENQANLLVAGTVNLPGSTIPSALRDAMISEREEELRTLLKGKSLTAGAIETKILVGKPFIEIIREVIRHERDLVIKPSDSVGLRSAGGTDMRLLRKCPCPVWIITSTEQRGFRKILVALDWEPENLENDRMNEQLMDMGLSLALSDFAELHLVHAWRLEHESFLRSPWANLTHEAVDAMVQEERKKHENWLNTLVTSATDALGDEVLGYLKPEIHFPQGKASDAVSQCVREVGVELVVMGTVARTGIPGFIIGNTAERILTQIDCSVLAMKPEGFVSPVTA